MPDDTGPASTGPASTGRPASERLAADALAEAKADARARGEPAPSGGHDSQRLAGAGSPARQRRPRRARREDPQPLGAAIDGLLDERGWRTAAAVGALFGRWDQIVGPELAAHTRPGQFADGELVVIADSTAWATQVRLLAGTLVRRLNEDLGRAAVRRVKVRGPSPPRPAGTWRVRGGRGPRDDYG